MRPETTMNVVKLAFSVAVTLAAAAVEGAQPSNVNTSSLPAGGFFVDGEQQKTPTESLFTSSGLAFIDFDGDGHKDLAISAPAAGNNGRVYLIFGPIRGDVTLPPQNTSFGFTVDTTTAAPSFGNSVSGGDLNGDMLEDLVIGTLDSTNTGLVAVIWGSKSRDVANINTAVLAATGRGITLTGAVGEYFGRFAAVIPSVNGDSYNDLIIGANLALLEHSTYPLGAVYLIYGRPPPWTMSFNFASDRPAGTFKIFGDPTKLRAGYKVIGCRDINGDGIGDFAFSGNNATDVYVVFGRTDDTWPQMPNVDGTNGFIVTSTAIQNFGESIACGDINGDGLSDLVIGSNAGTSATVAVLFGHNGTWAKQVTIGPADLGGCKGLLAQGMTNTGFSVHVAGDVNGDRVDDLVVGSPNHNNAAATKSGVVFVLYGHRSPWPNVVINLEALDPATTGFAIKGTVSNEIAGITLSSVPGDIDGDALGLCDIVFGETTFNNKRGRAVVVPGALWPQDCKTRDAVTGGCASCSAGYGVSNGACVRCSSLQNVFLDFSGECHSCVTGDCLKCKASGVCTQCTGGLVPSGANMTCIRQFEPPTVTVVISVDTDGATVASASAEIAAALGVPVQLVTVAFLGNNEVLVTISGPGSVANANDLLSVINNKQCN